MPQGRRPQEGRQAGAASCITRRTSWLLWQLHTQQTATSAPTAPVPEALTAPYQAGAAEARSVMGLADVGLPSMTLCRAHPPMPAGTLACWQSWRASGPGGGCVLCDSAEFERDGFGRQTVLICDQCEREFHVGCLHDHHMADLSQLPKGKPWPPLSNVHRCSAGKHHVMHMSGL